MCCEGDEESSLAQLKRAVEEALVLRVLKNTPEVQCCTEHICYWTVGRIKKSVYCLG